jgi:hypothetical protein
LSYLYRHASVCLIPAIVLISGVADKHCGR